MLISPKASLATIFRHNRLVIQFLLSSINLHQPAAKTKQNSLIICPKLHTSDTVNISHMFYPSKNVNFLQNKVPTKETVNLLIIKKDILWRRVA
jgi:hypothetical protein